MKKLILPLLFPIVVFGQTEQQLDSTMIRSLYSEVLANGECYWNLEELCKDVGARLSGSKEADDAIQWGKHLLEHYDLSNVHLQEVTVPHWTRGEIESGFFEDKNGKHEVALCALGGSVGCDKPITGKVIEVKRFEDLHKMDTAEIRGNIVFFNRAMDPVLINTGAAYGGAYNQRSDGASEAASMGASACIIRSLTHATDTFPHTGAMRYKDEIDRIPAAALSTVDAQKLSDALKVDPDVTFTIHLDCVKYPDKIQYNVIGEIPGTEFPDQYIVVGGHLDSWDIGEGAHDDGAGIVQSIEVLRMYKALDIKLKRTLRVVLFINEENGNNGGKTYAAKSKEADMHHFAAIESDAGGFVPRGFRIEGSDEQYATFKTWAPLFEPYDVHAFRRGFSGVDIRPLKDDRVALFGLIPDGQRYFDFHHSANDVFENVNKRELELGAGTIASLVYLIDKYGF
jgi:carboxypeptidase Q